MTHTNEEFFYLCRSADWFYMMADRKEDLQRGKREIEYLNEVKAGPEQEKILEAFKAHYAATLSGGLSREPKLEDFNYDAA
jgi:hypothetical protein